MKKEFIWVNNADLNGGGGRKARSGDWGGGGQTSNFQGFKRIINESERREVGFNEEDWA